MPEYYVTPPDLKPNRRLGWIAVVHYQFGLTLFPQLALHGRPGAVDRALGLTFIPALGFSGRNRVDRTLPLAVTPVFAFAPQPIHARPLSISVAPVIGMAPQSFSQAAFTATVTPAIGLGGRNRVDRTLPITVLANVGVGMAGKAIHARTLPVTVLAQVGLSMDSDGKSDAAFGLTITPQLGMAGKEDYNRTLPVTVTVGVGMAGKGKSKRAFGLTVAPQVGVTMTGRNRVDTFFVLGGTTEEFIDPSFEDQFAGHSFNKGTFSTEWARTGTRSVKLTPTVGGSANSYVTPAHRNGSGYGQTAPGEVWSFSCYAHAPESNTGPVRIYRHYAVQDSNGVNPPAYPAVGYSEYMDPGDTIFVEYQVTIPAGYDRIRFTPMLRDDHLGQSVFLDDMHLERSDVALRSYARLTSFGMGGKEEYGRALDVAVTPAVGMDPQPIHARPLNVSVAPAIGMAPQSFSKAPLPISVFAQVGVSMTGREEYGRTLPVSVLGQVGVGFTGREEYGRTLPVTVLSQVGVGFAPKGKSKATLPITVLANVGIGMAGRNRVDRTLPITVLGAVGVGMTGKEEYGRTLPVTVLAQVGIGFTHRSHSRATANVSVLAQVGVSMLGIGKFYKTTLLVSILPQVGVGFSGRNRVDRTLPITVLAQVGVTMTGKEEYGRTLPINVASLVNIGLTPKGHSKATLPISVLGQVGVGFTAKPIHTRTLPVTVLSAVGLGMAGRNRVDRTLPVTVLPGVGMTAIRRQVLPVSLALANPFTDNFGSSTATRTIGPFAGPTISGPDPAIVVCVTGYRTSSATFDSLTCTYGGVEMTPVGPIVWSDNNDGSNSSFARFFILMNPSAGGQNIVVTADPTSFMSPYFAVNAISLSGVKGYTTQSVVAGTEAGTNITHAPNNASGWGYVPGSRILNVMMHEPIFGESLGSYQNNTGIGGQISDMNTTTAAGKGAWGDSADSSTLIFTADRVSGADYLSCCFKLLPT